MQDRIVIVTGASSGIGRAAAVRFASDGAKVIIVGRNETGLADVVTESRALKGSVKPHLADLTEISQIDRLVSETIDTCGRIDVLVNSAGIIQNGSVETTTLDNWDKMMNINLRSVFALTQKCVPHLIDTKGSVVNVSSVAGMRSFHNVLSYCVSKAAVDQFTKCAAIELAPKGVRINAVNPGVVVTNLHRRGGMDERAYEAFLEHSQETHPLGRPGTPREVADLIYYLASDQASWVTGVTYAIDGGRSLTCAR